MVDTLVTVRPLGPSDDDLVRGLFADTMLLGSQAPADLALLSDYAEVCLGWFLTEGRHLAALAELDGEVVGYALACSDPIAQIRWSSRRVVVLYIRLLARLLTGRLDADSRRFYFARARDARALTRCSTNPPRAVQAHLNVTAGRRSGAVAIALLGHLDRVVAQLCADGWYGEINALNGRRARALERLGLQVIDRVPNRTLSIMIGADVERLTVVRRDDRHVADEQRERGRAP